jgi:hypothetical protein
VRKQTAYALAAKLEQDNFIDLICKFLYKQLYPGGHGPDSESAMLLPSIIPHCAAATYWQLPDLSDNLNISIFPSAVSTFYTPSDICGIGRMRCECIRVVPSWRRGPSRYDYVFINTDPSSEGMHGLSVAWVRLFFSFKFCSLNYPCALVHWFVYVGDEPDEDTGMWVV